MRDIVKDVKYFKLGWAYADVQESIDEKKENSWSNVDTIIENLNDYNNFSSKAINGKNYSGSIINNIPLMYNEAVNTLMGKDNFYSKGEAILFRRRISNLTSQLTELKENPKSFHEKSHKNLSTFLESMEKGTLSKCPKFIS